MLSAGNIEKESQANLVDFGKLQQGYQVLEAKRDNLRLSIEELNKEKGKLENKVTELEVQRTTAKGKSKLYETQIVALEDQKNSLEVSLKKFMEQEADVETLKKHALMLRNKIHQM